MSDHVSATRTHLAHATTRTFVDDTMAGLLEEIARLEAECMNLATHGRVYKRQYEQAGQDHATAMAEIAALRAENERLRTALVDMMGRFEDAVQMIGMDDDDKGIVNHHRAALAKPCLNKPSRSGDGIAAALTCPVGDDWCDWRSGGFHVVDGTCYDLKMEGGAVHECREAFCDDGGSNFPARSIVAIKRSR